MQISLDWRDRVLRPLLSNAIPAPLHRDTTSIVLLGGDVDKAQSYIFESSGLPDVRGASRLLSTLNGERYFRKEPLPNVEGVDGLLVKYLGLDPDQDVLYLGGGSILALMPDVATAEAFKDVLIRAYPSATGVATITVEMMECRVCDIADKKIFPEKIQALQAKIRRAKNAVQWVPFYERLPFMQTCVACQVRPAEAVDPSLPNEPKYYCHLCLEKRRIGRERRFWNSVLFPEVRAANAADLGQIGAFSNNDIALLYADGDGFGKYVFSATSPGEFKNRSENIRRNIWDTLYDALKDLPPRKPKSPSPAQNEKIWPYEIITVGGDDVLMILPATEVFTVTQRLLNGMQARSGALTLSIGITIGRASTPIRVLYEIARMALKTAKRRRFETQSQESFMDFHDITREGLPAVSLSHHRQHQYRYKRAQGGDGLLLTGRPYALADFEKLMGSITTLGASSTSQTRRARTGFPLSQLHALSDSLGTGFESSQLYYLYQRSRFNNAQVEQLERLEAYWGVSLNTLEQGADVTWPWLRMDDVREVQYYTPLRDLILLYDLTGGSNGDTNQA
ncbi:MAG: hypothetical protein DPW16_22165 [Chloroflexi bacterium]|nr:hypothetical protein [Chloroflexota bacterium]